MPVGTRFFIPPSLRCRLSIVSQELRRALGSENVPVDESLLERCVDVGVGSVGTASAIELIGVAYNLYKQQLESNSVERERAARKHYALKYLDPSLGPADRIFCYIMFKLPEGTPTPTKKIRDAVAETEVKDVEEWRENAYARFAAIPPVAVCVRIVLQELYIASIRSLTTKGFRLLKEKDIDCLVVYSEFAEFGFDVKKVLPQVFDDSDLIVVKNSSVLSLPVDLFAQIQKWRCRECRVCIACDTDGLTMSGLITARFLSLSTGCSHKEAVKAVKISHESFIPRPYELEEFNSLDFEEEEVKLMELQAPTSDSMRLFDRRMLENSIRSSK